MDIFNEAVRRLRLFALNNGFRANEEILKCPMKNNTIKISGGILTQGIEKK